MSSPLADCDRAVRDWLAALVGEAEVGVGPPSTAPPAESDDDSPAVTLHALDLVPEPDGSLDVHRPGPATVWVRYLICATHPGTAAALEHLDVILGRLLDPLAPSDGAPPVHLDAEATSLGLWSTLGLPPRPGVVVRSRATFSRAARDAPPVTTPLRVVGAAMTTLTGRLVGPGDVPIAGAEVAAPATGSRARTDNDGSFVLGGVPSGPLTLAIRVKGRAFEVAVEPSDEPLLVRCDPTEEAQ